MQNKLDKEGAIIILIVLLLIGCGIWAFSNVNSSRDKSVSNSPVVEVNSWKLMGQYVAPGIGESLAADINIYCDIKTKDEYLVSNNSVQVLPKMCASGKPEILP